MSAVTGTAQVRSKSSRAAQALFLLVTVPWFLYLVWRLSLEAEAIGTRLPTLLCWASLAAVMNVLPIRGWASAPLSADMPVIAAGMLVLTPVQIGLVMSLGALDAREFRGQVAPLKALYNRSQVGMTAFVASLVAHHLVSKPTQVGLVLPLAFAALGLETILNYLAVGVAVSLETRVSLPDVIRRLRVGSLTDFTLMYVVSAVLGAMLVGLYSEIGLWALLAFVGPALLGRQILLRSQMYLETSRAYQSRESVLTELSEQIHEERSDERSLIAADLHDEVLQPLFKVTLMAHVLQADLSSGRLLDLDQDLPELLSAAETASLALRELIGNLRQSALGPGGLPASIAKLTKELAESTGCQVHSRIASIETEPAKQLLVYQIAKEALENAKRHSGAANVWVSLASENDELTLEVRDDGVGFDHFLQKTGHFGLQIMRERAAAADSSLFVDSALGRGSRVLLVVRTKDSE